MQRTTFQKAILTWYHKHGRKTLPWQQPKTPYAVWISEIMLQQTQVATVIDYFQRFMQRFPNIESLAQAPEDDVLHLWSGLGYYSRARNLHKTAQILQQDFKSKMPCTLEELITLPGIGQSTAGAILSLSMDVPATILDGNVKRVLTRVFAVEGWPGKSTIHNALWDLAKTYTPQKQVAQYNQAMMDLGATLCTRSKPQCTICPLQRHCQAHKTGRESDFPQRKPAKVKPIKTSKFLLIVDEQQHILLEKRPPRGIWGGLWSLPECPTTEDTQTFCLEQLGLEVQSLSAWEGFRHTFSHYHLDIEPVLLKVKPRTDCVMQCPQQAWYNLQEPLQLGLPQPITRLLSKLEKEYDS